MPDQRITPLEQTISVVDQLCVSSNVPYAIIGGIAATVYGSGRTTIDVDLIVQTDISELGSVFDAFAKEFAPCSNSWPTGTEILWMSRTSLQD